MASPGAAGAAALVSQYFSDSRFWAKSCESGDPSCRSFTPSGVLIKTVMIHSGEPMKDYNAGTKGKTVLGSGVPDIYQGFGRVQFTNVLPLSGISSFLLYVRDLVTIGENAELSRTFKVTGNSRPLKLTLLFHFFLTSSHRLLITFCRVTLVWYDPPAVATITSKALVHDLDLILTSPSNKMSGPPPPSISHLPSLHSYYANRLSSFDRVNTVEQITISSPESGIWKLSVKSNALPYGQEQKFSVTMSCIGLTKYTTATEANGIPSVDTLDRSTEPFEALWDEETTDVVEPRDEDEEEVALPRGWQSYLAPLWAIALWLRGVRL
jgi:hypothetical protein